MISKRKATIVDTRTTTTATNWIFRIAAFIKEIISDNNAISFIYRNNNLNCKISNIRYGQENCYNCYWCRNPIEATIVPIGCPIKYIPSNVYKTYNSEINKNNYIMKEDLYINNLSKIIIKQKIIKNNINLFLKNESLFS